MSSWYTPYPATRYWVGALCYLALAAAWLFVCFVLLA
jgi:hypothetical protein